MADTPETKAKRKFRKAVSDMCAARGFPYKLRTNAAGGVGFSTGIADSTLYMKSPRGVIVFDVEVKAQLNKPTPKQIIQLREIHEAGCNAVVVWADDPRDLAHVITLMISAEVDTKPVLKLERYEGEF